MEMPVFMVMIFEKHADPPAGASLFVILYKKSGAVFLEKSNPPASGFRTKLTGLVALTIRLTKRRDIEKTLKNEPNCRILLIRSFAIYKHFANDLQTLQYNKNKAAL